MIDTPRKQKEKRILDLHNEGYTIRDIAKQERKSFRDIGAIIDREQERQETIARQTQQADIASQAYSLFSKGKSLVEVAINLKLRQPDVQVLYQEYLKLAGSDKLNKIYDELKDGIDHLVKLYMITIAGGINLNQVERLLKIANDDLINVEKTYEFLTNRVAELKGDIRNSAVTFQDLSNGISSMNATLRSLEAEKQKAQEELGELFQKRMKLLTFVRYYQNNNEGYLAIAKFTQQKVYSILSENKLFLKLTVQSLMELIASDPVKYRLLIGSMRQETSLDSGQLIDASYSQSDDYRSMNADSSCFNIHGIAPTLAIPSKQKGEGEGEGEELQQNALLLKDCVDTLVQEGEKKLFNNIVKQFVPAIVALLLLKFPESCPSLTLIDDAPLVCDKKRISPFQDNQQ
jgi:hypothetical protein